MYVALVFVIDGLWSSIRPILIETVSCYHVTSRVLEATTEYLFGQAFFHAKSLD